VEDYNIPADSQAATGARQAGFETHANNIVTPCKLLSPIQESARLKKRQPTYIFSNHQSEQRDQA
jgi:hypothetical protein